MRPLKKWILFHLQIQYVLFGRQAETAYDQLYWRIPHHLESSIRVACRSLIQEGLITGFRRNGRFYARISSAGTTRLHEHFPPKIWQERRWNSRFFFCFGQTEQSSRVLRQTAAYGKVGGVFLLPGEASDFTRLPNVLYIESNKLDLEDGLDLVQQGWNLETLSKEYSKISGQTSRLLTTMKSEKALSHNMKQQIQSLSKKFFSVLQNDPVLPAELLPVGFAGPAVIQMYLEVMRRAVELETISSSTDQA